MASEFDKLKREVSELLETLGVEDNTVLVSTHSGSPDKSHVELRNYNKITTDFLMSLPEALRDTEIEILRSKAERVKNGESIESIYGSIDDN